MHEQRRKKTISSEEMRQRKFAEKCYSWKKKNVTHWKNYSHMKSSNESVDRFEDRHEPEARSLPLTRDRQKLCIDATLTHKYIAADFAWCIWCSVASSTVKRNKISICSGIESESGWRLVQSLQNLFTQMAVVPRQNVEDVGRVEMPEPCPQHVSETELQSTWVIPIIHAHRMESMDWTHERKGDWR